MQNVSLCALFLLNACKLSDAHLNIKTTTHHTVRSAAEDINHMVTYMMEKEVGKENQNRSVDTFVNPLSAGAEKIAAGVIQKFIDKTSPDEDAADDSDEQDNAVELDYELYQTT